MKSCPKRFRSGSLLRATVTGVVFGGGATASAGAMPAELKGCQRLLLYKSKKQENKRGGQEGGAWWCSGGCTVSDKDRAASQDPAFLLRNEVSQCLISSFPGENR